MKRPSPERWTPSRINLLIQRINESGIMRVELISEFRFVSDDQLRISCSRFRSMGYPVPDVPPRVDDGRRVVDLSDLPSRILAEKETAWDDAPPERLPNLERGLDIATYWLLTWGVPITWYQTRDGGYVMLGGPPVGVAGLVERYFEERGKRLRRLQLMQSV